MDVAGERIVPMQGCDHRNICRFAGGTSDAYKTILNVLQDWIEELNQGQRYLFKHTEFQNLVDRRPYRL